MSKKRWHSSEVLLEDETVERITDEFRNIIEALSILTGRPSQWSGRLFLNAGMEARGTKPYNCDIWLRADLATSDERWRTLIHEALHSLSEGYNPIDYMAHRGWEEGVVEQLQRLLREDVLTHLNLRVDGACFELIEKEHAFNHYIAALESLRATLGADKRAFYLDLLSEPIRDRYGSIMQNAMKLDPARRKAALTEISKYKDVLDGRSW
jgi:hypothetical protein